MAAQDSFPLLCIMMSGFQAIACRFISWAEQAAKTAIAKIMTRQQGRRGRRGRQRDRRRATVGTQRLERLHTIDGFDTQRVQTQFQGFGGQGSNL
ncbi:hypothetical protein NB701_001028 [Pantoea ananatis]|nr:hypothetical protein [Pantoea ananatis]MCW0347666.1 hypothetical protein [Pantoea ananatis]